MVLLSSKWLEAGPPGRARPFGIVRPGFKSLGPDQFLISKFGAATCSKAVIVPSDSGHFQDSWALFKRKRCLSDLGLRLFATFPEDHCGCDYAGADCEERKSDQEDSYRQRVAVAVIGVVYPQRRAACPGPNTVKVMR